MLLHKLAHIKPDKRFGRVKQLLCKKLDKLGFADTRRADKDERCRSAAGAYLNPASPDGCADERNSLILTDNTRLEVFFKIRKSAKIAFNNLACGDARPKLNNPCKVILCHFIISRKGFKSRHFFTLFKNFRLNLCNFLIVSLSRSVHKLRLTAFKLCKICRGNFKIADVLISQVCAGAGFIEQVNRFVGQESVVNIPL